MAETLIGVVTHYFDKIRVAAIRLTDGDLAVGDTIHIQGHTTNLTEQVESMQIEHLKVSAAKQGQSVGIVVQSKVHEHDKVFKVTP